MLDPRWPNTAPCTHIHTFAHKGVFLNPIPTGEGVHCATPPPPTYSNISRSRWFRDLKLSDNLNDLICNRKKLIFLAPPPTLGYHSNVQSWRMLLKNSFRQFSSESAPELKVFLLFPWSVVNGVGWWNFGLIFRLMASWWQFSFRTFFVLQRP